MRCSNCGSENPSDRKFCGECGAQFLLRCSKCGKENVPPFRFCGECGAPLQAAASAHVPETSAMLNEAAPAAIAGNTPPEGERKTVTALFADLKGSTELMRDLDPRGGARRY
jgi:adenylate cyclase